MTADVRWRRARRLVLAAVAVPAMAAAVMGVEVVAARRGPRLDSPPLALSGRVGEGTAIPREAVWLGDSTAAGVGVAEADATLAVQVSLGLGGPVDLTVLARSGASTADVVSRQLPALAGRSFEVVFVSVGANDVTHLSRTEDVRRSYRRLVEALPEGAEVVILGVPDMGAIPRLAQPLRALAGLRGRQLDDVVREVAVEAGATYVDIAGETGPLFREDPDRYFAVDRYHPSAEGYRRWAQAVLAAVPSSMLGP